MTCNVSHRKANKSNSLDILRRSLSASDINALSVFSQSILEMKPEELIEASKLFHQMMLPGTKLRERMTKHIQRRLEKEEGLTHEEAVKQAELRIHQDFKRLGDSLKELEQQGGKGKSGIVSFVTNNAKFFMITMRAKYLFLKMVVGHIGLLAAAALSGSKKQLQPQVNLLLPIKEFGSKSSEEGKHKQNNQDFLSNGSRAYQAETSSKPQKDTFKEEIKSLSEGRQEAKKTQLKEEAKIEEDAAAIKVLTRAIHDTLMELQRLSPNSNINFSPAIWPFFTKADMQALLRQVYTEIARANTSQNSSKAQIS
ncbi:MAG: hypothetical protein GYA55_11120 [SAR324 cluster bacterium]|uniref:Uncharacterized protein n=1 Tax=SAR324 cluster bacterium TaxID=2024889 RepID=A0A7X9IKZ0_9DELT|nr:hypothetical protein [SAR324 cluster bacterium]